uniref:Uncharacterized protein n=1 Tax=Lactuca sativa TaxID=4236 RepID=A0A9R1VDT4_LACSA|nr:hypothetical protein LSAT_V11C500257300 [Lactuca sativa]
MGKIIYIYRFKTLDKNINLLQSIKDQLKGEERSSSKVVEIIGSSSIDSIQQESKDLSVICNQLHEIEAQQPNLFDLLEAAVDPTNSFAYLWQVCCEFTDLISIEIDDQYVDSQRIHDINPCLISGFNFLLLSRRGSQAEFILSVLSHTGVPLYPLQLDVVKHIVKLSPVRAVLACVFGNCILYGGNNYSSTMSGSLIDGLGSVQKRDADRFFFEFALDQSESWLPDSECHLTSNSEVAVTAEHSVNDGIEAKTSVKRFREHDSDSDLEHDELAAVGTNNLSVLTDTTNESGIWQDSPKSEAAEIDTTIFLSFGWENEKLYEKAVENFDGVLG